MHQDKKSFGGIIKGYFKFLCGGLKNEEQNEADAQQQRRSTIKKKVRLTFLLDRAIVKISRKNLTLEEFMTNTILSIQLERYLVTRLASLSIVLLRGEFNA